MIADEPNVIQQAAQERGGYKQKRLLRESKECIKFLKGQLDQLQAEANILRVKAEAHDTVVGLVKLLYYSKQGFGMVSDNRDWQIRDLIEALEKEEELERVENLRAKSAAAAGHSTPSTPGRPASPAGAGTSYTPGSHERVGGHTSDA